MCASATGRLYNCNNKFIAISKIKMAHLQVAAIDVEGFKFVSFKERIEDTRKLTRKRHLEDIE